MKENPRYTFLLPAFKARFFEEALLSIKNQTYKDFKVIVSDDCSPEDLKSIYDKVCADDPRFSYRRNDENMGGKSLVSHWNLLVDMCDTEFLIMASDDDVYGSNFLSASDQLLEKYPACNLLRGRSRAIDGDRTVYKEECQTEDWVDTVEFIHRVYESDFVGGIASFIYRTEELKKCGMFIDFPSAWFSDDATNFIMAGHGCCITEDITFEVRNSDVNISGQWGNPIDSEKKVKATYAFYNWMKAFMCQLKDSDKLNKDLLNIVGKEYKTKVRNNIQNYIYHCPMSIFIKLLKRCPHDIGLCHYRMLLHKMNGLIKNMI